MSTLHQLFSAFDVLCDKFAGLKVQVCTCQKP